jgi:hypothetical protein
VCVCVCVCVSVCVCVCDVEVVELVSKVLYTLFFFKKNIYTTVELVSKDLYILSFVYMYKGPPYVEFCMNVVPISSSVSIAQADLVNILGRLTFENVCVSRGLTGAGVV